MKLFLPQGKLEEWALTEQADLHDGRLFVGSDKASFAVSPAVHFAQLVSGTDDKMLLGKVKTAQQLQSLGAERMMDSVILGDTAYQVVQGYITEISGTGEGSGSGKASAEADLLAEFLLDKMT